MYQANSTQRNKVMDTATRMASAHAIRLLGLPGVSGWPRIMKNKAKARLPMMTRKASTTRYPMAWIIR